MLLDKKSLKLAKKILFIISLSFVFIQVTPHKMVFAKEVDLDYGRGPVELALVSDLVSGENDIPKQETTPIIISSLPQNQDLPYYTTYITATAYTSREQETDSSPFIAAWGDHVFWGMLASNAFPRGTKIQIPEYFGDKMFSVLDTMNPRYYHHIDLWMPELADAKAWGTKYVEIKVYK